eukprot:707773-Alexandrium_andersonii.AAC.1
MASPGPASALRASRAAGQVGVVDGGGGGGGGGGGSAGAGATMASPGPDSTGCAGMPSTTSRNPPARRESAYATRPWME